MKRGLKRDRKGIAKFYNLVNILKNPHSLRPIVATCGTAISILSRWLDYKLKQLLPFIETYIKNSSKPRHKLSDLGKLPNNARLVKADAKTMYTNIDTDHEPKMLRLFLEDLEKQADLPPDFNVDMILHAAEIVMRWNMFECGNCFFNN